MRLAQKIFFVMLMVLLCSAAVAWAETQYVSDQLIVSLREGPENNAKLITYLKTDTPVEVLEAGKEFSKVKTSAGEIGYIQKSYLVKDLPKNTTIRRLTQENETLNGRIRELEKKYSDAFSKGDEAQKKMLVELDESRKQIATLQEDLQKTKSRLAEVSSTYETLAENSQNVVAIANERNQLKVDNDQLSGSVARLEKEREAVMRKGMIQWFIAGAGVLVLGWVIGKFSRSRRKSSLY